MRRRGPRVPALVTALLAATVLLAAHAAAATANTVWLCKPDAKPNPCRGSLETTVYTPSGQSHVEKPSNARRPPIDCFYVYPTVSGQPGTNADRTIEPEERAIAQYQAARFSQVCRVFAPMYRQVTLAALNLPQDQQDPAIRTAFADVRAAWRDYLKHYNHGRGVVLLGHSQGAGMLTQLIRSQIDPHPRARQRLVSAILLGGNVMVKKGKTVGGDFEHVPLCTSSADTGCAMAYSTFNEAPPDNTRFGRPSTRFRSAFNEPLKPNLEVACTNPASLAGGSGALQTLARTEPFPGVLGPLILYMYGGQAPEAPTPWVQPQDHYTARCVHANQAHVLMLSPVGAARHMNPSPDASWGLHLADGNIALGDFIGIVKRQTISFANGF